METSIGMALGRALYTGTTALRGHHGPHAGHGHITNAVGIVLLGGFPSENDCFVNLLIPIRGNVISSLIAFSKSSMMVQPVMVEKNARRASGLRTIRDTSEVRFRKHWQPRFGATNSQLCCAE